MQDIRNIEGIIVPVATPMNTDESLDRVGLDSLVDYVIQGGVSGIFALGTTGEFPMFSDEERREVLEALMESINGRVPVLVGVAAPGTRRAVAYCKEAEAIGAAAVVVAAPYYYKLPEAEAGLKYFGTIARSTSLPVFLYNIPALTQMALGMDTVQRLAELPNVVAMKDSSSDFTYFARLIHRLKEAKLQLFQGNECHLLASLEL